MLASNSTPLSNTTFGEVLTRVMRTKRKNQRQGKRFIKVYPGIKWQTDTQPQCLTFQYMMTMLPKNALIKSTPSGFTTMLPSGYIVNGQELYKEVTFNTNGTWSLAVLGQTIDTASLGLHSHVSANHIPSLLKVVQLLPFCHGKERPKTVTVSELMSESWIVPENENPFLRIRTPKCDRLVGFTTHRLSHVSEECVFPSCRQCQRITVCTPTNRYDVELTKEDDDDMVVILDKHLPNASPQCKDLLLSQKTAHDSKGPTGHRWSKDMIKMCLSLYTRSPGTYRDLSNGGFLKLPSGRLLGMYKNAAPQDTGTDYYRYA
jgi:hypothetical protein